MTHIFPAVHVDVVPFAEQLMGPPGPQAAVWTVQVPPAQTASVRPVLVQSS
jgi:hypothetical protein